MRSEHLTISRHRGARCIRARVSPEGIRVTAPVRTPAAAIDLFVQTHWNHLQQTFEELSRHMRHITWEPGSQVPYLGQWYELERSCGACLRGSVGIRAEKLVVIPALGGNRSLGEQVAAWYRQQAKSHIFGRCSHYAREMGVSYEAIRVKDQSTRWGSCSSRGNLNFNWKLVTMPPFVLDYVVVHELAHRRHLNHGAEFWTLVQRHSSRVEEARAYLKSYNLVFA